MKAQLHFTSPSSLDSYVIGSKSSISRGKNTSFLILVGVFFILSFTMPKTGFGQLNGIYTINGANSASATNYKDFKSAITDLDSGKRFDGGVPNGSGVKGPVVFKIADGIYNFPGTPTVPTFFEIVAIPGSSTSNTVTFTSASSDSSKVLFLNCEMLLFQASNIIFSEMGFSQQLIPQGLCITIDKVSNITFSHCIFQVSQKSVGIDQYDTDTSENLNVNHSSFQGDGIGMQLNWNKNLFINNNIISNAPASSGLKNGHFTFFLGFGDRNVYVNNNTFLRDVDTAISVGQCQTLFISNNRIRANCGINIGEDHAPDSIINNTIFAHYYGIYDVSYYNVENLAILNNNIYTDSVGKPGYGACIWVNNKYAPFNTILNNNLQSGPNRAALYFTTLKNVTGTIDYNNYYSADSFVYFGSKYANLSTFRYISGFEKHGLNVYPQYYFNNNLTTGNKSLEGKGIAVSNVKYDIEGNLRNKIAPTIGSYEIAYSDSLNVWPGDANNDGKADINDILSLGVKYNNTGAKRANASISWTAQPCTDWNGSFKNGINEKFADCNGDGVIDSADISPISGNFSKSHFKASNAASGGSPTDPPLTVKFYNDSVKAGDTVTAVISLGSSAIKAYNVYGITLSIDYHNYKVGPKQIIADFSKSWLGNIHKNMISLIVNDSINKIIYTGLSRTDHLNISGSGEIGLLTIYMPDNVGGKREVKDMFNLNILDYKSINANEDTISLNPISDSIIVYQYKAGVKKVMPNDLGLRLYPSPANGEMHVTVNNNTLYSINIKDVLGNTVYHFSNIDKNETIIDVHNLPSGIYLMDIFTKNGACQSKFVIE